MFYGVFVIHQIYVFFRHIQEASVSNANPLLSQTSLSVLVDHLLQPDLPLLSFIKQMVLFLYS